MSGKLDKKRELFKKKAWALCKEAEGVALVLDMYDAKVRAELKTAELEKAHEKQASLYIEMEEKARDYDYIVAYAARCEKELETLKHARDVLFERHSDSISNLSRW